MEKILVYGMTDNPGGIETYLVNAAHRLHGSVHMDFVSDFPSVAYEDVLSRLDAEIYLIPAKGKRLFAHWRGLWKILKQHPEYKTVYFNLLDAGGAFTELIPWLLKRKIVTHSHNGATDKVTLHRVCRPFLKLFTAKRVACSGLAADYMFGSDSGALVIPNAIDTEKYAFRQEVRAKQRRSLGVDGALVVCHVGRLTNQKNPYGLLEIFQSVLKKNANAYLLSIGTGEIEKEVRTYAEKLGIQDRVLFLGKRNDVAELMQAADVFLLPSFYEGLPIVGIEAQAAGLPCVMSDCITKEVDITGNVTFLSLEKSKQVWAETVLEASKQPRRDTVNDIISHGYDNRYCEKTDRQLAQFLTE